MARAQDLPRGDRASPEGGAIDAAAVEALFVAHGPELRRMILGVVRDPEVASDVMQATFARAIERGHTAREETLKGWLFRVGFHEALAVRRRQSARDRAHRRLAGRWSGPCEQPEEGLIRGETVERVRLALTGLPPEQRAVVLARLDEDKTFAEIAGEAGLPLGTVLTRMRLAVEKLRKILDPGD